jgi:hypothetical protein
MRTMHLRFPVLPLVVSLAALLFGASAAAQTVGGSTRHSILSVRAQGGFAYVHDQGPFPGYLRTIDARDPTRPVETGSMSWTSCAAPVMSRPAPVGGYVYVTCMQDFLVADVSDPAAPRRASSNSGPIRTSALAIASGRMYAAGYGGFPPALGVYSLDDPVQPRSTGSVSFPDDATPHDVVASSTTAYAATNRFENQPLRLYVVDAADPAAPRIAGSVALAVGGGSLALGDGVVYVGLGSQLFVVDVGDPAAPAIRSAVDLGSVRAFSVVAGGGRVYVGGGGAAAIVDASDPTAPRVVGTYSPPGGQLYDLALEGTRLYVAAGDAGLRIVDVADPAAPREIGALVYPRQYLPSVPQRSGV